MNWKCLFFGCVWGGAYTWHSLGERLQTCTCRRCGATRTEAVV